MHRKGAILKDLDAMQMKFRLELSHNILDFLLDVIRKDSEFLCNCNIIDYSLLIGVSITGSIRQSLNPNNYINYLNGLKSVNQDKVYFIGIIDILTFYNSKKKAEHLIKSTFVDNGVSCVPPNEYQTRFFDFI